MRTTIALITLTAAMIGAGCSALLPPKTISGQQTSDLSSQQLQGVHKAKAELPGAQKALVGASQRLDAAKNASTVAQQYAKLKSLEVERAEALQNLAQGQIKLVNDRIQAERARAIVQAHPEMQKKIDVNRYVKSVADQQSDVGDMRARVQSLNQKVDAAYTDYRAATEKFGQMDTSHPAHVNPTGNNMPTAPAQPPDSGNSGRGGSGQNGGNTLQTTPLSQ